MCATSPNRRHRHLHLTPICIDDRQKKEAYTASFFCAFFQIAFTKFSHQGKVGKSLYKTKNVARRPQNFDYKKSYPTKITQIMAKFGCYVKHSSLQKGVFRHKIVKTLRKGINHPPHCKQKTKRRLFCVAVPLGTCRQRNRGKIGKTDTPKDKLPCLTTTESFSLLPLPLLQTRCQTLELHPEQKAFACRRLPIRQIQNVCVLPTGFG